METPLKWKQRDCRGLRGLPAPFCGLGKPGLCRTKIFAGSLSFQIDPSVPQRLGYMHTTTCNSNCICANAYYLWTPHYPPIQIPVHLISHELISPPRIDGQAFLLNPAKSSLRPSSENHPQTKSHSAASDAAEGDKCKASFWIRVDDFWEYDGEV